MRSCGSRPPPTREVALAPVRGRLAECLCLCRSRAMRRPRARPCDGQAEGYSGLDGAEIRDDASAGVKEPSRLTGLCGRPRACRTAGRQMRRLVSGSWRMTFLSAKPFANFRETGHMMSGLTDHGEQDLGTDTFVRRQGLSPSHSSWRFRRSDHNGHRLGDPPK